MTIKLPGMVIFKERAGIVGPHGVWVCFHGCWMYTGDTFLDLLLVMISEWKSDRHLVG